MFSRLGHEEIRRAAQATLAASLVLFAASLFAAFALFHSHGVIIDFNSMLNFNTFISAIVGPIGCIYTFIRWDMRLSQLLCGVALLLLAPMASAPLTYAVPFISPETPLADSLLYSLDSGLGFDWLSMFHFAAKWPEYFDWTFPVYATPVNQGLTLFALLAIRRQVVETHTLAIAFSLGLIACTILALWIPAVGAYHHFGLGPSDHAGLKIATQRLEGDTLLAVRGGKVMTFSYLDVRGIVAFPSFHAAIAVIFGWAGWQVRLPLVGWAFAILNCAMMIATPLQGAHYLVDVLAGASIGTGAVWAASRFALAAAQNRLFQYMQQRIPVMGHAHRL